MPLPVIFRRPAFRWLALTVLAPLTLGGCHKATGSTAVASGEPVAAVAPPAGRQWSDIINLSSEHGMVMGNPNAPVKLVEYGSLSCPHCAKLTQETMPILVPKYVDTGKVSYEFRSFAIHPQDVPLTVLLRCAQPSAFFGMVEQLYANFDPMNAKVEKNLKSVEATMQLPIAQRYSAMADAAGYTEFFAAHGLAVAKAHACLADLSQAEEVAREADAIGATGIDSTPTLILNGSKISALSWPEIETALKGAGA